MQREIKRGASADAGLIFHVFVQDSTATDGSGKASIAFSSFSCRYIRNGEAISGAITPQDITTIGTYAAPSANTNIRIKAVDNTNMIGIYEVQIHSDWVNTTNSCQSLTIYLSASGAAVRPFTIQLVAFNPQDAVRLGLTALPNAAADAAGGLPISDAGGLDLDAQRSDVAAILVDTGTTLDGRIPAALGANGNMKADVRDYNGTAGTFSAGRPEVNTTHAAGTAWGSGAISAASIAADAITAAKVASDVSAEIADAVWDEARAGHVAAGSFGEGVVVNSIATGAITAAAIATDAIDADAIAADAGTEIGTSVWATAARTLTAATNITSTGGSVPITAGGLVSADVTAISTDTAATDNLEAAADGTGYNLGGGSVVAASVTGAVGSVTGNVGGNVTGSVGSLATQAKADVNAEVVDTLSTDTIAELAADPGATPTLVKAIMLLYMKVRNLETATSSTATIANNAGTTILSSALSDNGTTFSKAKLA